MNMKESSQKAVLLLADGTRFEGRALGARGVAVGEVVFHTSGTSTHQLLTTPACQGQILAFTTPLIGNCGVNEDDAQGTGVFAAGMVVRECCREPSNFRSRQSLPDYLSQRGVVAIEGVDTRALTRHLRDKGSCRGAIVSVQADEAALLRELASPAPVPPAPRAAQPAPLPEREDFHVAVLDLGCCRDLLLGLTLRGCRVTLLAPDTPFDDIAALGPDGVLLSDGPERLTPPEGALQTARALLQSGLPLYGADAGHQLLAVAAGCRLEPLPAGHRGPNHPVHATGGATFTTTQRHGLTVVPESVDPARAAVTHVNRNDGSVEGLRYAGCPAFSTQYLPDHRGDSTGRADAIGAFLSAMAQRKEGGLNA